MTTFELCKVELDLNRLFTLSLIEQQCFSSSEMIIAYSPHFRDWLIGIPFELGLICDVPFSFSVPSPRLSGILSFLIRV